MRLRWLLVVLCSVGVAVPAGWAAQSSSIQHREDDVHATGDVGNFVLCVRKDTATALAGTDGDYAPCQVDATGRVHVNTGTVTITGALTNAELRATPVPVSGTLAVTGALTNTELRAVPVPVSGPLTNTELRATPVPVSGTVTATATQSGIWSVRIQDGSGQSFTSVLAGATRSLDTVVRNAAGGIVEAFGGTSLADDAAFTTGVTPFTPVGGVYYPVRDTLDGNDAGAFAITQRRAVYTSPETPLGVSITNEAASAMRAMLVDNAGAFITPSAVTATNQAITVTHATTTGGALPCYRASDASTNSILCKATAGQLYGYDLVNTTTTLYFLRLYNQSSAPTCASGAGFIRSIPIPPAAAAGGASGLARDIAVGEAAYTNGLGFCLTSGAGATDVGVAAAGVYITLQYK